LAATLKTHFESVVRGMFYHRSNAFFEAMNGVMQQAKRAARGFRTAANFIAIAYLRQGKLTHLPTSPFVAAVPAPVSAGVSIHSMRGQVPHETARSPRCHCCATIPKNLASKNIILRRSRAESSQLEKNMAAIKPGPCIRSFLWSALGRRASGWAGPLCRLLAGGLTILCVALTGMSSAFAQSALNHSVRAATFNAYLLSPLFKCLASGPLIPDCLNQITNQTEGWAHRLADTILANPDRFDILVLNEAWDEDAKTILVNRLKSQYPVYVKKLDADLVQVRATLINGLPLVNGVKLNGEDSGLMLFVRRGFSVLPLPAVRHRWGGRKGTLQASTSQVAFKVFSDYASDDGFAAKGVGFIRLRHTASGTVYNVAFTHLQADYPEKNEFFRSTRKLQLDDVRRLIEESLAPLGPLEELLKEERLIVAGDLNISVLSHGKDEWKDLFKSDGSFWTRPLYDSWKASSPDASRGETSEVDEDRLDYILTSVAPYRADLGKRAPMCVQHTTIPVDFQNLESDHFMVHADLNRGFWHCHPRIAYEVNLAKTDPIDKLPGNPAVDVTRIAYPGAMQWFHVKTGSAGTYSILRFGQGTPVKIDVYAPEDLTTPISRYNKTTSSVTLGKGNASIDQFVLPTEYYVRITGSTRSWTGNYALQIRRHTCASRNDACLLQPGQPQSARLTGEGEVNTLGQIQNEAWFRFDVTGQSDAGVAQTIKLIGIGLPNTAAYGASLVDVVNTGGQPPLSTLGTPGMFTASGRAGHGVGGFVVLKQIAPGANSVLVAAHFDTTFRLMDVGNLVCKDETNPEVGSDDMYTRFFIDGAAFRYPASGYKEFDCDNSRHSRDWSLQVGRKTIAYVDSLKIRLLELDDASADDASRERTVPSLAANETTRSGKLNWSFSDGQYVFFYTVRKRPNEPVK